MFECNILMDNHHKDKLQFFLEQLKQNAKGLDCIVSVATELEKFQIHFACKTEGKKIAIAAIKKTIALCGVKFYKKDYMERNLGCLSKADKKQSAFKKALSYFDDDTDIESIYDKVEVSNLLHIDSFYEFQLRYLKQKWDRICSLANENPISSLCESSFISLLEFLVDNTPYNTKIVKITPLGKVCKMVYENNELEVQNEEILEKMIELSPQQIIFDGNLEQLMQSSKYTFHIYEKKIAFHLDSQMSFSNIISSKAF